MCVFVRIYHYASMGRVWKKNENLYKDKWEFFNFLIIIQIKNKLIFTIFKHIIIKYLIILYIYES